MLKKHIFGSFNMNNFDDIFMGILDTYTIKINPPTPALGGGVAPGVHGKVCWLVA